LALFAISSLLINFVLVFKLMTRKVQHHIV